MISQNIKIILNDISKDKISLNDINAFKSYISNN